MRSSELIQFSSLVVTPPAAVAAAAGLPQFSPTLQQSGLFLLILPAAAPAAGLLAPV